MFEICSVMLMVQGDFFFVRFMVSHFSAKKIYSVNFYELLLVTTKSGKNPYQINFQGKTCSSLLDILM